MRMMMFTGQLSTLSQCIPQLRYFVRAFEKAFKVAFINGHHWSRRRALELFPSDFVRSLQPISHGFYFNHLKIEPTVGGSARARQTEIAWKSQRRQCKGSPFIYIGCWFFGHKLFDFVYTIPTKPLINKMFSFCHFILALSWIVCTMRFRELAWIILRQFSSHVIHIWSIPRLNYIHHMSECMLWEDAIHLIHKYWLLSHIVCYIYDVLLGGI